MKKEVSKEDDSPDDKNKVLVETESIILLRNQIHKIENMSETEAVDMPKIILDQELAILEGTDAQIEYMDSLDHQYPVEDDGEQLYDSEEEERPKKRVSDMILTEADGLVTGEVNLMEQHQTSTGYQSSPVQVDQREDSQSPDRPDTWIGNDEDPYLKYQPQEDYEIN